MKVTTSIIEQGPMVKLVASSFWDGKNILGGMIDLSTKKVSGFVMS